MVTWTFRNVPQELDDAVREEAKVTGQNLRATVLHALCMQFACGQLANSMQPASKQLAASHQRFTPPTVDEVRAEVGRRGYHFDPEEFSAWYEARGWRMKSGPMKDWKAAMVTWEKNWKKGQEEKANGRKLNYAEQRIEDNKRVFYELFGDGEGAADRGAGDDAGRLIQRTDAKAALYPIRRAAR